VRRAVANGSAASSDRLSAPTNDHHPCSISSGPTLGQREVAVHDERG
jgi:hypothetical protein